MLAESCPIQNPGVSGHDPRDFLRFDVVFEKKQYGVDGCFTGPDDDEVVVFFAQNRKLVYGSTFSVPSKRTAEVFGGDNDVHIGCVHFFFERNRILLIR